MNVAGFDACVAELVAADVFSGALLVAQHGRVLYERAAGLACKSFGVPNHVDTKFNLGSMNKVFTAVAIAQLAEQGKLAYGDAAGRWLGADWLAPQVAGRITIEHLLTHTSGLGDYFNERFTSASRERFRTLADYQPLIAGQTPRFAPGARWRYSNAGYMLLGAISAAASGQDYFDYVREHVYRPAGMTDTDAYELDRPWPNLAVGYSRAVDDGGTAASSTATVRERPPWTTNLFKHVIRGGPAGGGFSTVHDLLRFDRAMRGGVLVRPETAERMWTPKPASPRCGYGFMLEPGPGGRIAGHTGEFAGISSALEMHLDSDHTIVVLSNHDHGSKAVVQRARELLYMRAG